MKLLYGTRQLRVCILCVCVCVCVCVCWLSRSLPRAQPCPRSRVTVSQRFPRQRAAPLCQHSGGRAAACRSVQVMPHRTHKHTHATTYTHTHTHTRTSPSTASTPEATEAVHALDLARSGALTRGTHTHTHTHMHARTRHTHTHTHRL